MARSPLDVARLPPRGPSALARLPVAAAAKRSPLPAFDPAPDPIDESKLPGDPEGDCASELDHVHQGFRDRQKAEAERFKNATDTGYYFTVIFETGTQAEAVLKAMGCAPQAGGDLFVDGRVLAEKLGVDLPKSEMVYKPLPGPDKKLTALVRKPVSS